jgi:Spy/CpxP family protein refolding chaperone
MRSRIMTGLVAVVLALAGTFAVGSVLHAQQGGGGFGEMGGPFGGGPFGGGPFRGGPFRGGPFGFERPGLELLRRLDLTEDQRKQVRTILESHKSEFQQIRKRIREDVMAERTAAEQTPPDVDTIRAKATDFGLAQGHLVVLMAHVRAEVLAVLTPDQQAKLQALKERLEKRREEFRKFLEEWRQQHQDDQSQQPATPPDGQ